MTTHPPCIKTTSRTPQRDGAGRAVLGALGITAAIFCGLPYIEHIGPSPDQTLDLTPAHTVALPSPPPPPPPEPRREPEPPPPTPELAEPRRMIPLNVALDLNQMPGTWRPGDFAPGFSLDFGSITGAGGIYELSDLDTPPRPVAQMRPQYPARARTRRIEGSVTLTFVVDLDGTTRNLDVVAAQPEGIFEEAALRAAARWRFSPGLRQGAPVPVRVRQTIRFELDDY